MAGAEMEAAGSGGAGGAAAGWAEEAGWVAPVVKEERAGRRR